jgi:hypothetical protein
MRLVAVLDATLQRDFLFHGFRDTLNTCESALLGHRKSLSSPSSGLSNTPGSERKLCAASSVDLPRVLDTFKMTRLENVICLLLLAFCTRSPQKARLIGTRCETMPFIAYCWRSL